MPMNIDFNKNEDVMKMALSQMRTRLDKIALGGGKKAIEKQREKNKLTPRERISYLVDENAPFIEIGAFAGYEMYEEQGGCPAGGTVAGVGYVSGRQCVIVANDQTVKAGAWFPITGKKTQNTTKKNTKKTKNTKLPFMSDETLMVEGNGSIFLANPKHNKTAIGED